MKTRGTLVRENYCLNKTVNGGIQTRSKRSKAATRVTACNANVYRYSLLRNPDVIQKLISNFDDDDDNDSDITLNSTCMKSSVVKNNSSIRLLNESRCIHSENVIGCVNVSPLPWILRSHCKATTLNNTTISSESLLNKSKSKALKKRNSQKPKITPVAFGNCFESPATKCKQSSKETGRISPKLLFRDIKIMVTPMLTGRSISKLGENNCTSTLKDRSKIPDKETKTSEISNEFPEIKEMLSLKTDGKRRSKRIINIVSSRSTKSLTKVKNQISSKGSSQSTELNTKSKDKICSPISTNRGIRRTCNSETTSDTCNSISKVHDVPINGRKQHLHGTSVVLCSFTKPIDKVENPNGRNSSPRSTKQSILLKTNVRQETSKMPLKSANKATKMLASNKQTSIEDANQRSSISSKRNAFEIYNSRTINDVLSTTERKRLSPKTINDSPISHNQVVKRLKKPPRAGTKRFKAQLKDFIGRTTKDDTDDFLINSPVSNKRNLLLCSSIILSPVNMNNRFESEGGFQTPKSRNDSCPTPVSIKKTPVYKSFLSPFCKGVAKKSRCHFKLLTKKSSKDKLKKTNSTKNNKWTDKLHKMINKQVGKLKKLADDEAVIVDEDDEFYYVDS